MTKRRIIAVLVACVSLALFVVQTQSKTGGSDHQAKSTDGQQASDESQQQKAKEREEFSKRLKNMTPNEAIKALQERDRQRSKERKQHELEHTRKMKELAKEGLGPFATPADRRKRWEEFQKREAKIKREFLREKEAIGATEEQWKIIKSSLEKVRELRERAYSGVGMSLAGGPNDNQVSPRGRARSNVPTWQWESPWKDKGLSDLTDAQKLAKRLIALVENKRTTPEQFERAMEALRKARRDQAELERQLAEANKELCQAMTTRQKAALVLMGRL